MILLIGIWLRKPRLLYTGALVWSTILCLHPPLLLNIVLYVIQISKFYLCLLTTPSNSGSLLDINLLPYPLSPALFLLIFIHSLLTFCYHLLLVKGKHFYRWHNRHHTSLLALHTHLYKTWWFHHNFKRWISKQHTRMQIIHAVWHFPCAYQLLGNGYLSQPQSTLFWNTP